MPRYLERSEVLEIATKYHDLMLAYELAELPTADVVEVVRCRDCKWWKDIGCAICIADDSDKPKENDFCSFGERSDDAVH